MAAARHFSQAEIEQRGCQLGRTGQRALQCGDRGFERALLPQRFAEPKIRLGYSGIDGERTAEQRGRVVELPILHPQQAQFGQQRAVVRLARQ